MNATFDFDLVIQKLAWTLVHSTWQFAGIAAIVLVGLRASRVSGSHWRYLAYVACLNGMIAASVATFLMVEGQTNGGPKFVENSSAQVGNQLPPSVHDEKSSYYLNDAVFVPTPPRDEEPSRQLHKTSVVVLSSWQAMLNEKSRHAETIIQRNRNLILTLWLAGAFCLTLRLLLGWLVMRKLRRSACTSTSDWLIELAGNIAKKMGVGRVIQIAETSMVQVPAVIGWLSPMILLPTSVVTGMPREQLEAVIAHEIAHVRRHDFLVNLCQLIAETVFFYHPLVWWVSTRIREQREMCCDDFAIQYSAGRKTYVSMLMWIEEARVKSSANSLALSASDGSLVRRIKHIAQPGRGASGGHKTALALSLLMLAAAASLLVLGRSVEAQLLADDHVSTETVQKDNALQAIESQNDGDAYSKEIDPFSNNGDDDPFAPTTKSPQTKRKVEQQWKQEKLRRQREAESMLLPPLPPDPAAQRMGEQIQKEMTAVDDLPAFLIRSATTHTYHDYPAGVIGLRDRSSLENLIAAMQAAVPKPPRSRRDMVFAWRGKEVIADSRSRYHYKGEYYDQPSTVFWDGQTGWRHPGRDDYGRYASFADTFTSDYFNPTYYLYFGDHRFSWARHNQYGNFFLSSPFPVEYANYQSMSEEEFGGELCNVIRSIPRQEQFWISKKTGQLRGILYSQPRGFIIPPTSEASSRLTGRKFETMQDFHVWHATAPHEEVLEWAVSVASARRASLHPDELVVLSDYREIAPGVSIPMTERHVSATPKGNEFAFHVRNVKVEETQLEPDLGRFKERAIPNDGDSVNDWRHFRTHVKYRYAPNMPDSRIRRLVAEKTRADLVKAKTSRFMTEKLDEMIGKSAPKFPFGEAVGPLESSELVGNKTLVYFWASWCDPCKDDIAKLNQMHQGDWKVIGVHKPKIPIDDIAATISAWKIQFPVVLGKETGNTLNRGVSGYPVFLTPYCVVINKDGSVSQHGTLNEISEVQ